MYNDERFINCYCHSSNILFEFVTSTLFLAYVVIILLLILVAVNIFNVIFRINYVKQLQKAQEEEQKRIEDMQQEMEMQQDVAQEVEKSGYFSELGKKSAHVRQERLLEQDINKSLLQTDEAQVALAVAEEQFPELFDKWYPKLQENPKLVSSFMNIIKKYQKQGVVDSNAMRQASNGNSNWMRS